MSILLENVTKRYEQQTVVKNVSLEIESGEFFVLLGASGSGKSTLLRLIAGLIALDGGRISLHGRDVTALPPQQRNTGFVFQNYSLFKHMNVAQNIEFGLDVRHIPRQERRQRVAELLKLIDLEGYERRMPSQLSGGQQQRVALARALAYQPEVLLLDEPFGALDARIRVQLRQNLRDIQKRLKITTILVTHDQEEAFELADRIGVIDGGELLEVGEPSALYRRPQNRFTATFLGSANLLRGLRNGSRVHLDQPNKATQEVALAAPPNTEHLSGQPVEIFSRPEEVEIALSRHDLRGQVIGRGVVQDTTFAGPLEKVCVQLQSSGDKHEPDDLTIQALLSPDEARTLSLEIGTEVWVGLKDYYLLHAAV
jgi:ABC-type Fe3+/spermidine/putrescine transport system ATPase subunit